MRNVSAGEDQASAKSEIARSEWRQNEVATVWCCSILRAVLWYKSATQHIHDAKAKLMPHRNRVELLSVAYRLGEGSTETMLQLWQTESELQREVEHVQIERLQQFVPLQSLVLPLSEVRSIPIIHSQK